MPLADPVDLSLLHKVVERLVFKRPGQAYARGDAVSAGARCGVNVRAPYGP
jgi:hypothetical protein